MQSLAVCNLSYKLLTSAPLNDVIFDSFRKVGCVEYDEAVVLPLDALQHVVQVVVDLDHVLVPILVLKDPVMLIEVLFVYTLATMC